MNFQEKVFEATADVRSRALALADAALAQARIRAGVALKRMDSLKGSLSTLSTASRELTRVARRHGARFVQQSSTIALDAGKDVSALARTTIASLGGARKVKSKRVTRATRVSRKRAAAKAA